MKVLPYFILSLVFLICGQTFAQSVPTAAIHLITYQPWGFTVDNTAQGERVRHIIDESHRLGFRTVIFNFRAHMIGGTSSDIRSTVPAHQQANEERFLLATVDYAKSKGMKVAFRPILLVVGPKGEFPYTQGKIYWWHGVIKPKNIDTWFDAYFKFHERYMKIAALAGAEWYSIGAEMNSMTSGLGEREPDWRLGYPKKWVEFIRNARTVLNPDTKVMYGINYTDQYIVVNGQKTWGGEMEQWRHYMTADFTKPVNQQHQKDLRELWSALDVVGIDYYRALASSNEKFSNDFQSLVSQLEGRPQSHASQIDTFLTEMGMIEGDIKPLFFQEVGYRSVEKCFLDPASYEEQGGKVNLQHQAAAWEAFFRAYWMPQWPWMTGVGMWQILVDETPGSGPDKGFSPLGKEPLESVLKKHLN